MSSRPATSGSVLITGATGFVGRNLCGRLLSKGQKLRCAVRYQLPIKNSVVVGDIGPYTRWGQALADIDTVIHLAARVHVMDDGEGDPLTEFRRVNVAGTINLALQAAAAGIKKMIFISTVKVHGEETQFGNPYSEQNIPDPLDAYSISKHEAEKVLRRIAEETGLDVVIIRPPLVYGPDVKANFLTMMRWLKRGIPLPLGFVNNRRSFVALDNLVDLIVTCIDHPAAANQIFLVSDGEDISTTDLLRRLGHALGRPARLVPVPVPLLHAGGVILGKQDILRRLCGSLQVDISKAKQRLGWVPPISVDEALQKTARGFLQKQ